MASEINVLSSTDIESEIIGSRLVPDQNDLNIVAQYAGGYSVPADAITTIIVAGELEYGNSLSAVEVTALGRAVITSHPIVPGQPDAVVALAPQLDGHDQLEERHLTYAVANHYTARRYIDRTHNIGRAAVFGGPSAVFVGTVSVAFEQYALANTATAVFAGVVAMTAWFGIRRRNISRREIPKFKDVELLDGYRPLRIVPDQQG